MGKLRKKLALANHALNISGSVAPVIGISDELNIKDHRRDMIKTALISRGHTHLLNTKSKIIDKILSKSSSTK